MTSRCATAFLLASAGCIAQAWAATYMIQPDGGGDFPTIQAAIDASSSGDVIKLTSGVFRGTGNRDLDYQGKAITIQSKSGNPALCILDCEGSYYQPHRAASFHNREPAISVLDGVTIRNGFGPSDGGALEISSDARPTIRRCVMEDNQSHYYGGAVNCSGAAPLFQECIFRRNHAPQFGGAVYAGGVPGPRFESCQFVDNDGMAGALWCDQGSVYFESCSFTDHMPATIGVAWGQYSDLTFSQCLFERNSVDLMLGVGGGDFPSKLRLTHCTVRDNRFTGGSFIRGDYCDSLIVEGCTITDNELPASNVIIAIACDFVLTGTTIARNATGTDRAVLAFEDCLSAAVSNTILAFHPGTAVSCLGGTPTFECVDIFANEGGDWSGPIAPQYGTNGNISADPIFCEDSPGDYHIRDDSPCGPGANPECGLIGAWPVGCYASSVDEEEAGLARVNLRSLPNPFVRGTRVILRLPGEGAVSPGLLTVCDAAGRRIRTLRDSGHGHAPAGDLWWDGTDEAGRALPAGVYLLRLATQGHVVRRSVIKLR